MIAGSNTSTPAGVHNLSFFFAGVHILSFPPVRSTTPPLTGSYCKKQHPQAQGSSYKSNFLSPTDHRNTHTLLDVGWRGQMFAQNIRDKKLECPKAGLFFDGTVKYLDMKTLNGNNSLEYICERDLKQSCHLCFHLSIYLSIHTYMHACMHTYIHTHTHTVNTHTYICTYMNENTNTHTCTYSTSP